MTLLLATVCTDGVQANQPKSQHKPSILRLPGQVSHFTKTDVY